MRRTGTTAVWMRAIICGGQELGFSRGGIAKQSIISRFPAHTPVCRPSTWWSQQLAGGCEYGRVAVKPSSDSPLH